MTYCLQQPFGVVSISCKYPIIKFQKLRKEPTPQDIIKVAVKLFNISLRKFNSEDKKRYLVDIRRMVVVLIRKKFPKVTYTQIGLICGKRDHSTICYSFVVHDQLVASNKDYYDRFMQFSGMIDELIN